MSHIRPEVYKAVKDNDLNQVVFSDPFSDVTRKAKRNVVAASFICLLITLLNLEVKGFLGLQAPGQNLGHELAVGLACALVTYFFITFIFHAYIDYSSWQFRRERQLTAPYLELVHMLENHINVTGEQVTNATKPLNGVFYENDMRAEIELKKLIDSALGQLKSVNKRLDEISEEIKPLLQSWSKTIQKMNRLNWRLRARFVSLWLLDIAFTVILSTVAIYQSYFGLDYVFEIL